MSSSNFDVIVVGAGAAGLTAAIALARAGFRVVVVEAAAFPGAENWSGCVYFCENLAHPEVLGPAGVEALAWERRLVERGFFATDGYGLLGMTYRDPAAFRHCYTVLRPVYDHHLAQAALRQGVALLTETTAESLIREDHRVIGVATSRGPLYADLVFLAEGDASHLVAREGYERYTDPRELPHFLQGIKQVIDLPPGAIEETFGVGPEEGVAYEMLLRNGTLRGRPVHLNVGGFLYTNRQSLSVGLVLPADHLAEHFGGDPNLLLEWFEDLPALRPWLEKGRRGLYGAKVIRGGGVRDIPTLIDDGLAIGGAASAIGTDFPYPNFTGPATFTGLLLARAACRIREETRGSPGGFTRERLERHYLEPLRRSHYWQDVEFLKRWPGYVKKSRVFFGGNLDLALGSAYVWTRPNRWPFTKWTNWLRLLGHAAGPGRWQDLRGDLRHLVRALRLREVTDRPAAGQLLLDGAVNALRDLFGRPRANLPPAGTIRLHYAAGGGAEPAGATPQPLRRWFRRFAPVLASAARRVYTNDDTPLRDKLPAATGMLLRQVNLIDLLALGGLGLGAAFTSGFLAGWDALLGLFGGHPGKPPRALYRRYARAAQKALDMTPAAASASRAGDARLARLAYHTAKASHIHVLWPQSLPEKNEVTAAGLWHVCPARVYEARVSPLGQLQVVVNFENCIKCETCWRTSNLVDWGRDGRHRFIYPVATPVVGRLLQAIGDAALSPPTLPHTLERWGPAARALAEALRADPPGAVDGEEVGLVAALRRLLATLEGKLREFDQALEEEPRTIDRARAEYLEMLARYAQQLAARVVEELRGSTLADSRRPGKSAAYRQLLDLASALATRAEERARRTWDQRYSWAAADGRQLRQHHLPGLRALIAVLDRRLNGPTVSPDPALAWLRAEQDEEAVAGRLADWSARLDAVFGPAAWRDLERDGTLTSEQDAVLRDLLAQVPALDPGNLSGTLHPPFRKALLAELGRRDPSLAYRAASHLWARDLARLAPGSADLAGAAERWARGDEWACFTPVEAMETSGPSGETTWQGEALLAPARGAGALLLLLRDRLAVVPSGHPGLHVEPLATLGLRGAGLARVRLDGLSVHGAAGLDHQRLHRIWSILSAADLTSIASGMARQLCLRAVAHATSRVQFPGLFHDEQARDTIGKFGAVKKMIAEMGARRLLIETLDHNLSPTDFSAASLERAGLVKALAAEALGTAPGSLSYNAGQVFGGTGYSEDDQLAKLYRDAAAWRYLGPPNPEVYLRHGQALLRDWRPDGSRLAAVPDEGLLFEQVAQRKALQAELDEVRNLRSRLRATMGERQPARASDASAHVPPPSAQFTEGLARQDAHLLAGKALLLRAHARLEQGLPAEVETALIRVWLQGAAVSLDEFEDAVREEGEAGRRDDRPVVEPSAGPPVTTYADYLAAPCPYDSGDFLTRPLDLLQPRFVPEMVEADPDLAARDRGFRELLAGYFGWPRGEGILYERYVERRHRPDPEDLDFCRQHGFFRMPIPKPLGGEGRPKVDYYLLTTNAHRLADVAISLTIQVNSSLGTTPILLARDKDLPKAQKEIAPFVGDPALQQDVRVQLERLLSLAEVPDPRRIGQALERLNKQLADKVLARTALKVLFHRFGEVWKLAGLAARDFDLPGLRARLREALDAWNEGCGRAEEWHGELGRRREACDLFLRWIASGQISAFALTEPSAGSDTARVGTRARLRSVPVEVEPDGVLRFVPAGGKEPRYLLDARRLVFTPAGPQYRWSDAGEPAPIHFDEYDYETDDPTRTRWYDHGGRRVHFTDVAQLRERDGRRWYDYWELNGAKMWITNGRMAGVFCLYAKTEEGVTGFLVDRHAEGLIVGKDEEKMGQCGSPTNELALQGVRVPRENVLGLEGRGQVNALETLNVGRAGLAMSAVAQMEGLIAGCRAFAQGRGDLPDWVRWRLERMEEDRFIAEALAFEVVGRFEHPQTRSVRLESAAAKMLVSELWHRTIELAEDCYGPAGQTQLYLVEKRKRDARVLNIYEGANEVQRFFILKDLAAEVAPRWAAASPPQHAGREAVELEHLKGGARQRIEAARALFGQDLWQNPNLQANCFLLAEAAAWLKAADSTLGRLAWLARQSQADDSAEPSPRLLLARRAVGRCLAEVRDRLRRFDEELAHLRRGFYAPEVRAASLLFAAADQTFPHTPAPAFHSHVTRPLSVLVVVEPSTGGVPHPQVADGRLLEPYRALSESDQSALESAFRLRDEGDAPVTIEVAAVASRVAAPALRPLLSLGADRVRLVVPPGDEAIAPASAAAALAAVLGPGARFDLVLGGAGAGEDGLTARFLAEALGLVHAGDGAHLAVQANETDSSLLLVGTDGRTQRHRTLPAAAAVEPGLPLRPFDVAGYLANLSRNIEVQRWPKRVPARVVALAEGASFEKPAPAEEQPGPLTPPQAARRLLEQLGQSGTRFASFPFEGVIEDVGHPALLDSELAPPGLVLAVAAIGREGNLEPSAADTLKTAEALAGVLGALPRALVIAPPDEALQRRGLAQLAEVFSGDVVLLAAPTSGPETNSLLLLECWPDFAAAPRAVVGEPWTGRAFASLAWRTGKPGDLASQVRRVTAGEGQVVLEGSRERGKLNTRRTLDCQPDDTCWITLTEEAETPAGPAGAGGQPRRVQRWSPRLERFYGLAQLQKVLEEVEQEVGVSRLADADFIIDVGFGVGTRDGYEAVIEPLERVLRELGVRNLAVGGSRKVTEELHLLPPDRQIGQSGVSVNPQVLLAIGISGAPQHLNYIGPRATVLAFNRDPEAPLMTLNQRQPRPRVFPVVGDLFETVPALIVALQKERPVQTEPAEQAGLKESMTLE